MENFSNKEENGQSLQSVESILLHGFALRPTRYVQTGFMRFGAEFGIYVAYTIVYIALLMLASSLPFVGDISRILIGAPLAAGFLFYARLQQCNEFRDFSSFFLGFKNGHWPIFILQSIVVTLAIAVATALPTMLFYLETIEQFLVNFDKLATMDPEKVQAFLPEIFTPQVLQALFFIVVMALLASTFFCLAPCFIVYRRYSAAQAISASCRIVVKKYPQFLFFNALLWLVLVAGFMICCVGLLATLPVYYLALASAYEEITGD